MDAEKKVQKLGEVITTFKHDIEDLHKLVNPGTPLEKAANCKSAIEDFATQLEELEKEAKFVTDATTQFWGSVVQDEKLEQINTQLEEAEEQLDTLSTLLRTMPPVVQVTKEVDLKKLQE